MSDRTTPIAPSRARPIGMEVLVKWASTGADRVGLRQGAGTRESSRPSTRSGPVAFSPRSQAPRYGTTTPGFKAWTGEFQARFLGRLRRHLEDPLAGDIGRCLSSLWGALLGYSGGHSASTPKGKRRSRTRPRARVTTAPLLSASSTAGSTATSSAACSSTPRSFACRSRTYDGWDRRWRASSAPKSVSLDTTTRRSAAACSR
jgi:hypothetical protein